MQVISQTSKNYPGLRPQTVISPIPGKGDHGGIKEEISWKRHYRRGILEEKSWKRNPGREIMEEDSWEVRSWKRNNGKGILGEESRKRNLGRGILGRRILESLRNLGEESWGIMEEETW